MMADKANAVPPPPVSARMAAASVSASRPREGETPSCGAPAAFSASKWAKKGVQLKRSQYVHC